MAKQRPQVSIWRSAGKVTEAQTSPDDVVREAGWVFNNETGERLTLEDFVATGTEEVGYYCHHLALFWGEEHAGSRSFVEIGSGIGRMTAALTRNYAHVTACDLDAAFLERCRETVVAHGDVTRLETAHVADARTLPIADRSADVVFSYITLQHCEHDDALALVREALRVVKPGGRVALNFRTWTPADVALVPVGKLVRFVWRVVPRLSRAPRLVTRFGWQANRAAPADVVKVALDALPYPSLIYIFQSEDRDRPLAAPVPVHKLKGVHRSHWWLVVHA